METTLEVLEEDKLGSTLGLLEIEGILHTALEEEEPWIQVEKGS